jgi:hypothetical protein
MPTPTLAEVVTAGDTIDNQQITLATDTVNVGRLFVDGGQIGLERTDSGGARLRMDAAGLISIRNAQWAEVSIEDSGDVAIATSGVTLRLRADGNAIIALPTSDPAVADALWNDNGTVKVSAG